jgi:hypothetical protein
MEGILFFQDRSVVTSKKDTISGGSSSKIDGVLYFPKSNLVYSGGSSLDGYTTIVANTLTVSGNSTLNDNYSSLADGAPGPKIAALIE